MAHALEPILTDSRFATIEPEMAAVSIGSIARMTELNPLRLERWLTPAERATYHSFEVPKRRQDWLAGRIAAKDALARRHQLSGAGAFLRIELRALPDGPQRGRPVYRIDGVAGRLGLSLSHCADVAVAALGRHEDQAVGADLERVEERESSFESLALSAAEFRRLRGWTGARRSRAVTAIWVLKEALSKALGTGLRLALPLVTVNFDPRTEQLDLDVPFHAVVADGQSHPLLVELSARRVSARLFEAGDLLVAWVVLGDSEEP
jgi:phosphopantetheinyl transferase